MFLESGESVTSAEQNSARLKMEKNGGLIKIKGKRIGMALNVGIG